MSPNHSVTKQGILNHWLTVAALILISTLLLTACNLKSKSSQDASPEETLLQFLRYIPDEADYRAWVAYGDAAAWHTTWNVPRISNVDELKELDETSYAYWMGMMANQTYPPDCLGLQYIFRDDLRESVGFNLFDMDRYLAAGAQPKVISVLESDVDPEGVADLLAGKGYVSEELADGWILYSINEDYKLDMQASTQAEKLGTLNRILLSDQIMLVGRATEVVEAGLDAYQAPASSLAENKDFIASTQALFDASLAEAGELVGVIWIGANEQSEGDFFRGQMNPTELDAAIQQYGLDTDLPKFSLAAFGTRHNGDDGYTTLILAVVFPLGTDMEAAAGVLEERLEKAYSLRMRKPFLETLDATDYKVYAVEAGGLPVVLATFRLEAPELKPIAEGMRPSGRVRTWMEYVIARDFMYLYTP